MTYHDRYPAYDDLRNAARKRLPHFVFEYLDSGTGRETGLTRNRAALDDILFLPQVLGGAPDVTLNTRFLGRNYALPFGIAPIGMSGLIWPGAEYHLAQAAQTHNIPYALSSVATREPEQIGPIAGDMGWFQLYCPADASIRDDMLARIWASGFKTLIVTLDVSAESRRERQRRTRIGHPPHLSLRLAWQAARHPDWLLGMLRYGIPRLRFAAGYVDPTNKLSDHFEHAGRVIRGYPDAAYFKALRKKWPGALIAKGISDPADALRLRDLGADAIWVSNHSARQLEAAPASITQLPKIRSALGPDMPIIFDSGVICGLDIMRAIALGADFVMLGRAFHFALAALGAVGADHLIDVLRADLHANMGQIGAQQLDQISARLIQ